MVLAYFSPPWFFGYDVALEISFAIISILVSIIAFRIFKRSSNRNVLFLGISFSAIGFSYLIESILNFMIITKLNAKICIMMKISSVSQFENAGLLVHIFFMSIGLSFLLYTTLKDKRLRMLWLLLSFVFCGIFFSRNILYMFYLFSTISLTFISWHFILNYLKCREKKTLLISIAFLFLLFGSFHFIIAVNHHIYYVIGHILEFFAYLFILINLYLVLKK